MHFLCHVNQPGEAPLNFLQECAVWVTEQFVGIEPEQSLYLQINETPDKVTEFKGSGKYPNLSHNPS